MYIPAIMPYIYTMSNQARKRKETNMTLSAHELAVELLTIKEQMEELLSQAEHLLRTEPEAKYSLPRAEAYWIPHLKSAFGGYGYNSMCSLEDTINELEEADQEEEEDDPFVRFPDEA